MFTPPAAHAHFKHRFANGHGFCRRAQRLMRFAGQEHGKITRLQQHTDRSSAVVVIKRSGLRSSSVASGTYCVPAQIISSPSAAPEYPPTGGDIPYGGFTPLRVGRANGTEPLCAR
jgi:hypothetical protein